MINPNARAAAQLDLDALRRAFAQAGYDCRCETIPHEAELEPLLADIEGLVVTAGGDGTFRAVAQRLLGKKVPLAILPLGTANNIFRTFSCQTNLHEIIAGLQHPDVRRVDVGRLHAPWGQEVFIEGAGCGLYADVLATYRPEEGKSFVRALAAIAETLNEYKPQCSQLIVDGQELSAECLMIEVLNTPAIGPRLRLAPEADPTDGMFDILRIQHTAQRTILAYLRAMTRQQLRLFDEVQITRGRKVELLWQGQPFHVDGEVRPKEATSQAAAFRSSLAPHTRGVPIEIEMLPGALELWLPKERIQGP